MFNAYTYNSSLPGYNAKFNNLETSGSISLPQNSFDTLVIMENGQPVTSTFLYTVIGDLVFLSVPKLANTTTVNTNNYKAFVLPLALRPLSGSGATGVNAQKMLINSTIDAVSSVGMCLANADGTFYIYCNANMSPAISSGANRTTSEKFTFIYRLDA